METEEHFPAFRSEAKGRRYGLNLAMRGDVRGKPLFMYVKVAQLEPAFGVEIE